MIKITTHAVLSENAYGLTWQALVSLLSKACYEHDTRPDVVTFKISGGALVMEVPDVLPPSPLPHERYEGEEGV